MTDSNRLSIEKRWVSADRITAEASRALDAYHPVLRQVLFNRGVGTAEAAEHFLAARAPAERDPLLLLGMPEAVARLTHAIQQGEPVAVYGDYDADGVTATALLVETLAALGGQARAYIPNRFEEGYGLNNEALSELAAGGVKVVVSVDCGIRSVDEAAHARKIGLDLIITDHHTPGPDLPGAFAVINAKRPGDPYPDKHLAGVGTAFKLASALARSLLGESELRYVLDGLMDLVAIGTIADMVPLVGENRYLVRYGLKQAAASRRQGLYSLMQMAGIRPAQITAANIGFGLGPRLNAAGRLESAMAAYDLLTTKDVMEGGRLAQQLDNQNRERQALTRRMQELAEEIAVPDAGLPYLLFAAHPDFNAGVVGLTASRLAEQYYRPSIVAHRDEETTRGSCRSIPEFHITNALDQCADLLLHHGGHAAAAGFTVPNHNLDEFVARMAHLATSQLAGLDLRPTLLADAEVQPGDLTMELLGELEKLQPTGYGNPEPLFIARNLRVTQSRTVGRDQSHLKLTLADGRGKQVDAIAFRMGHWQADMPAAVDVAFQFEQNEYNGRITPQMNVRDMKASV
jgi:single-stranded-DNA-specific exonuclease